jgi:amino acid adenylation domain-containing protein/thioester reductase-like protein
MPYQPNQDICSNERDDIGLAQLLQQQLKRYGDQVAIESAGQFVTFRELHFKALSLMREMKKHQIRAEEPVGILTSRGVNHILSQIAVVYAGGSCVPLDDDHSDQHLGDLLRNLGGSIVLTSIEYDCRLPELRHIAVTPVMEASLIVDSIEVSRNGPMCRSHVFHTSGSTGQPKAVQILAMGLTNLVFNDFSPVRRGDRLAHVSHIGFDVSLWEIWSGLLHGATLVVFERGDILDPWIFPKRLKEDNIDVIWQTTSLLATVALTCPKAYSAVDTLLTGGEAINLQTIRTILAHGPPRRIFNVYGPTELSVFSTFHQVSVEDVNRGHIPIGRPLGNYEAFIVDDDLQPVSDGTVGKLLVGGAGVAAGYFDNPQKTAMVFVAAPHLHIACKTSTGLFYNTGDLVRMDEAKLIHYVGRVDNQVKILGRRIELESIERCLLDTALVCTAVAMKVESEDGSSMLVANVLPVSDQISPQAIIQSYIERAPQLMVPRLNMVSRLALTGSGKVDRKSLAREYTEQLESAQSASSQPSTTDDIESHLRKIWLEILQIVGINLKSSDDFFALGGTSLQMARLVLKVQQSFAVELRVAPLFEKSTLKEMCQLVAQARDGVQLTDKTTDIAVWLQDSSLGRGLKPILGSAPDWKSKLEGRVFLTGVTGFVGSFLLAELVAMPQVNQVACLVRGQGQSGVLLRIQRSLKKYGLCLEPAQKSKILAVPGDFVEADLGLGQIQYQRWAAWSSVVFHLGAQVDFLLSYSSHRAANVLGILNMIRFSNTERPKALHYTSSISAFGPTGLVKGSNTPILENEKPVEHIKALSYDTGYAQSQCVAEGIAWDAVVNGLPVTIHRLGFVLGHSKTGTINPGDFFSRLIPSCLRLGYFPLLPRQREDFVPVDWVVSTMLHIASDPGNNGQAYNLVQPDSASIIDISSTFDLINQLVGDRRMRGIPYWDWIQALSQSHDHQLLALVPMLREKIRGDLTRWQMQQDMPQFSTENLRRALADASDLLLCPHPSTVISRCLLHWLQVASLDNLI